MIGPPLLGASRFVEGSPRLHYLEYGGAGPDVLVVPGITTPAAVWEFVSLALADFAHVVTVDTRGRGLSEPAEPYDLGAYGEDVQRIISSAGLDRPVVIGHSMGARIVAALAVDRPTSVSAVVVVDPPTSGPGRRPYPNPLSRYVDALHEAQQGKMTDDKVAQRLPAWTPEQRASYAAWLPTCDETAVIESYHNFHREDFHAYWSRIALPCLFVYGDISPVVSTEEVKELARMNTRPTVEIEGIPEAAHMIPWDNPGAFIEVVKSFIIRTTSTTSSTGDA